ncbi:MAG: dTDP-4-dehydrorhamnose reductase [Bacteroidetes bacterium]|nr:dTDP-4-dehydrorhamnose reductase [Bacteroidota bacterium]MBS1649514.1 dTDP-4-dehydrorhamnose reductase [Bacteroidota bacterium]
MNKPLIIVAGKNGQLGYELQRLHNSYAQQFNFLFVGREELDLNNIHSIINFFQQNKPSYFINCAAYTAVDKAETEKDSSFNINALAVGELAKQCAAINCKFITVSTDYVFDGTKNTPYETTDATYPLNQYGHSKREGELLAIKNNKEAIIIRTSWVYSSYGNNFVKTMLRLMKEKESINVVSDQIGSPTYAKDLADAIMQIVNYFTTHNSQLTTTIYHYSNEGVISWYDFAKEIQSLSGLSCKVNPIPSSQYPTPAKRPFFTAMSKELIANDFQLKIKNWKESLKECLAELGYL